MSFLLTKKVNRVGVPSLLNNRQLGVAFGLKSVPKDYTHILNVPQDNVNNVLKWFKINNLDVSKTIAISVGASKKRQDKCLEDDKCDNNLTKNNEKISPLQLYQEVVVGY